MADTTKLKDMLDNIVDGNDTEAKIDFHSYLQGKMREQLGTEQVTDDIPADEQD